MNKKLLTSFLLMGLIAGCAGNSNSTSQSSENASSPKSSVSSESSKTSSSSSSSSNLSSSDDFGSDTSNSSTSSTFTSSPNQTTTSSNTSSSVKDEPVVEYNATVYYYNSNGWTNINCYSWDTSGTLFGAWPGSAMTPVEGKENWYEATFTAGPSFNVVFNNGSAQTPDIAASSENKYFYGNSTLGYSSFEAVEEAMQTAPSTEITIYFANSESWSTVYCYAWLGSVQNGGWPGVEMTQVVDNIYSYTLDTVLYGNIIFGDGTSQTVDISLTDVADNTLFSLDSNSSGKWTCTTSVYEG